MDASSVLDHLRQCGVVVHLVAPLAGSELVVFLEAALGQQDLARRQALVIPGVTSVSFSDVSTAVMYLSLSRQGPNSCADARLVDSSGTPPAQRRTTKLISGIRARPVSVT
jgi:hypothetical protein